MTLLRFRQDHAGFEKELARAIADTLAEPESSTGSDPAPPPAPLAAERSLLEANADQVGRIVARYQAEAAMLEAVIAERQDRLKQTRIAIEAFSLALKRLTT